MNCLLVKSLGLYSLLKPISCSQFSIGYCLFHPYRVKWSLLSTTTIVQDLFSGEQKIFIYLYFWDETEHPNGSFLAHHKTELTNSSHYNIIVYSIFTVTFMYTCSFTILQQSLFLISMIFFYSQRKISVVSLIIYLQLLFHCTKRRSGSFYGVLHHLHGFPTICHRRLTA